MGRLCLKFVFFALASVMLGGCATITEIFSDIVNGKPEPIAPDFAATYFDGKPRVRVGVSLVVQVGISSQTPTTMNVQVDQTGDIVLPLLLQEPVHCDGLTLEELKDKLVQVYSVYYKQPQIMVTFAPFDARSASVSPWGTVMILGEVSSPGPVNMPSTKDLTLMKVIQIAGGLKPFADHRNVQITRCDKEGKQTKFIVNIDEIGKDGRIDKDLVLTSGDVIWVPETWY